MRALQQEPRFVMASSLSNGSMLLHLAAEYGRVNVAQAVYDFMGQLQQQLRASPELYAGSRSLTMLVNSPLTHLINAGNNSGARLVHGSGAVAHGCWLRWTAAPSG
jgi:hypothetical protein